MNNLIYRGVTHDGHRTTTPRSPRNLIYRGAAHDGLSTAASPVHHRQAEMCYRGVRYNLGADGVIAGSAEALSSNCLARITS